MIRFLIRYVTTTAGAERASSGDPGRSSSDPAVRAWRGSPRRANPGSVCFVISSSPLIVCPLRSALSAQARRHDSRVFPKTIHVLRAARVVWSTSDVDLTVVSLFQLWPDQSWMACQYLRSSCLTPLRTEIMCAAAGRSTHTTKRCIQRSTCVDLMI